jgi:primase-polymerase (primpol)-like protein
MSAAESRAALRVKDTTIPAELKALRRWVCWRAQDAVDCRTGGPADLTDPATWATFEKALACYREQGLDGIGFVLTGDGYCVVELDDCHDPRTGQLAPWASDLVKQLDSYFEVSTSGTGVTVFVRSLLPTGGRRHESVAVHAGDHVARVTGWRGAVSGETVETRQPEALAVYHKLPGQAALSDEEVLAHARHAKNGNGAKFGALWEGDTTAYRHKSRADLALCAILAYWVQGDAARVEALFGPSAMSRGRKWSGDADYRRRTVHKALKGLTKFYTPGVATRRRKATPVDRPVVTRIIQE